MEGESCRITNNYILAHRLSGEGLRYYGAALLTCFEGTTHPLRGDIRDVIPYDQRLWVPFRRTDITYAGEAYDDSTKGKAGAKGKMLVPGG